MQMHLNKGYYGGKRYISDTTETAFQKQHKQPNATFAPRQVYVADWVGTNHNSKTIRDRLLTEISANKFGHQGFTGTMVWADPEERIVYFLVKPYPSLHEKPVVYTLTFQKRSTASHL